MNVVLIGLRGSGKSTVGKLLAEKLGREFSDTDTLVQQRAKMTISEIFAQHGEPHFRALESAIVCECAARENLVIATGGGAILKPGNAAALKAHGFVVHLNASAAELWRRVSQDRKSGSTRPQLLKGAKSGVDELAQLMAARAEVYARARDTEICVENRTPDEIVEAILKLAEQRGVTR